jgi:uncharacterized protein
MNSSQFMSSVLAVFLVIVAPLWDYFEGRALKANPSGKARRAYYWKTTAWLCIATGLVCWAEGYSQLVTLKGLEVNVAWLQKYRWGYFLLATLAALIVLVQLVLPVVQVTVQYRKRPFLEPKQLEPLRFFLPAGAEERRWFTVLCLTAGFCEEVLFRGFLLRYLRISPLHIPFLWAALAAALIFGTHHLYQGVQGLISTTIGGLVFTVILLVTGSLYAGMLYHAAVDMAVLVYWRPKPASSPVE